MKDATKTDYQQRILTVLGHIQDNLDAALPLEELAQAACMSPFHFHRFFTGMVGETVAGHIRRIRLERAAHQLIYSGWEVTRIAFAAGYQSHESFTRAFTRYFGTPPSRYRSRVVDRLRIAAPNQVHFRPAGGECLFTPTDNGGRTMEVAIKDLPERKVAFVRHVGPYDQVGPTWDKLCVWAAGQGLLGPGVSLLGVSWDDPDITEPAKIRYDACLTVARDFTPQGEVGGSTIPGGKFACHVHKGPYSGLAEAYHLLFGQWLPASGHSMSDYPAVEVYLSDPEDTPPEELLTEIQIPLAD